MTQPDDRAQSLTTDELVDRSGPAAVFHSDRFRKVANRYPRQVVEAYGGDVAAAAADTDEQVAARVATWEQAHGLAPRDWPAIGRSERAR